jgi:hypothetical protein
MGAGDRTSGGSQVKQGLEQARQKASETAKEARHRGKERLEKGKDAAADQVQQLAGAVEEAAGRLEDNTFASYASDLGRRMSQFADSLHNRSVDDIAEEVRSLARRNPTLFLLGSVALGVALSRFLKASARRSQGAQRHQGGEFEYGAGSRTERGSGIDYSSFSSGSPSADSVYREDRSASSGQAGQYAPPSGAGGPGSTSGTGF